MHAQLCLTLCDPMECSLPGSSVHGIFQARMLEWVVIYYSRIYHRPRDQTQTLVSPAVAGRLFTTVLPRNPFKNASEPFYHAWAEEMKSQTSNFYL